jgi:hypothetical protein
MQKKCKKVQKKCTKMQKIRETGIDTHGMAREWERGRVGEEKA